MSAKQWHLCGLLMAIGSLVLVCAEGYAIGFIWMLLAVSYLDLGRLKAKEEKSDRDGGTDV